MNEIDKATEWVLRAAVAALGNTPEAKDWIERVYKLGTADGSLATLRGQLVRTQEKIKEAA